MALLLFLLLLILRLLPFKSCVFVVQSDTCGGAGSRSESSAPRKVHTNRKGQPINLGLGTAQLLATRQTEPGLLVMNLQLDAIL